MDPPKPYAYTQPHTPLVSGQGSSSGASYSHRPAPPSYSAGPSMDYQKFDPRPKYQDKWAAVLFVVHLALFAAIAGASIPKLVEMGRHGGLAIESGGRGPPSITAMDPAAFASTNAPSDQPVGPAYIAQALVAAGASAGSALLLSLAYLLLIQRFAGGMIRATLIISIILTLASSVLFFVAGLYLPGALMVAFSLLYVWAAWSWRSRIPFAAELLEVVAKVTRKYHGTVWVALFGLFVSLLWAALFTVTVAAVVVRFNDSAKRQPPVCRIGKDGRQRCSTPIAPLAYVIYLYCLFSFYWTSQVIRNTVHVTVCGVFGTYYFLTNTPHMPTSGVTLGALKRATTTSFGSVCFGSLLIAIIQFLRALAQSLQQNAEDDRSPVLAFIACLAVCLLSCIESMVEYFNHYAFTQVAIYGKPFVQAGRDTWRMIKDRGVDALINDNLIGNVLGCGTLLIGMVNMAIGYGVLLALSPTAAGIGGTPSWPAIVFVLVVSLILGLAFMGLIGGVVESGVATTFVALAEDPHVLARQQPELFERVRRSWPGVVQGM